MRKSRATKCSVIWGYIISVCIPELTWNHLTQAWVGSTVMSPCQWYLSQPKPPCSTAHNGAILLLGPNCLKNYIVPCRCTQSSGKSAVWMDKRCHFSIKWLNGCSTSNLFPWQCRNSNGNTGSFLLNSQYKEQNKNLFSIWMNKSRSISQCKHVKPKPFPCPDHSKIHE